MLGLFGDSESVNGLDSSIQLFLEGLQLQQYEGNFRNHEIDLDLFFTLTNDDLKNIGIDDEEHRKLLLNHSKPSLLSSNESCRSLTKEETDAILTNSYKYLSVLKLFIKELDPTRKKNEIRNTSLNSETSAAEGIVTFSDAAIKCLRDLRKQYQALLPSSDLSRRPKRKSFWNSQKISVFAVLLAGLLVSRLILRK